jgi:hypothetical protein
MAIPHADSQEFSCSDSSGNPKTVLRRVDELQVTCDGCAPHSTGCSKYQVANTTNLSAMCRHMESTAAGWVRHLN